MTASTRPLHVCLLTGGGDAPGLNAVVRAFYHAATRRSIRVSVSRYGFEGLLGRGEVVPLRVEDVRGILPRGGSILGCSTTSNPFARPGTPGAIDVLAATRTLLALEVDGLVLAGGDGTMGIARRLGELGVDCIGIPKTIDGDLGATEQTCGIDTAVETATRAIDALHSTAEAHQRVMIVEVMGRSAGWLALRAGIAGGADAVLIPEIPYDPDRVVAKIREREALGLRFSIVVIGEGARPAGGQASEIEPAHAGRPARLGGAGQRLAGELGARAIAHDVRVTVLGHLQRGGTPTAADRLLATSFGAHAAELCAARRFGRMVTRRGGDIDSVPLTEVPAAPCTIEASAELVRCARSIGIELGAP
ncbi:MAG: ATP-dependent 6-phosphofructokinase [Polyangiaceae bacterium]|jgi:6-phosphofructokinase 1